MKFRRLFSSVSFAFLIPVAGALMVLNYGMYDYFVRSIGKEILFTGLRVAIAAAPDSRDFNIGALRAHVGASEFVRPVRAASTYLHSIRPNEVLVQRMGMLRYHFVFAAPGNSRKLLVFEIFSEKMLWLFQGSTAFVWLLLLSFTWAVRNRTRKDEQARENLMKEALEAWLRKGEISTFVTERFPRLMEWWERRQAEFDHQTRALHDIKVPLAALERGGSTELQNSVRDIHTIIAKPKVVEQTEWIDVQEVVRAAAESARGVDLKVKVSVRSSLARAPKLKGSALELRRHLTNLLVNAIEATGGPLSSELVVELIAEELPQGLSLRVRDWGRGIPEKMLARIGQRGFTFGKEKGTGYGLHYCRKWIVELGGSFAIDSEENEGTTISILFPWEKVSFDGAPAFRGIVADGAKVVVLEDDPLIRDVYRMVFPSMGLGSDRVVWANDETDLEQCLGRLSGSKFWILSDYYFEGTRRTGPQVLKERGLAHRAILLSNIDVNEELREELRSIGLPALSKAELTGSLALRRQDNQPEQGIPAHHDEQHPACAVR